MMNGLAYLVMVLAFYLSYEKESRGAGQGAPEFFLFLFALAWPAVIVCNIYRHLTEDEI